MHVLFETRSVRQKDLDAMHARGGEQSTLYQCFFTEPSVLVGKVCRSSQLAGLTARGETGSPYLGNLGPAIAGVSHLLEAQLLLRGPRRVGPALLGRRLRGRGDVDILGRGLGLTQGRGLRGGRRRRRRLDLARGDRSRRGPSGGGLGRVGGRAFPLAGRLRRRLGWRLLLTAWLRIGRLLRNIHGRLDGRRVMLLLSPHVGLGGAVGELHALIATGHVGLVSVVAVCAGRSAVLPVSRHGIALHESVTSVGPEAGGTGRGHREGRRLPRRVDEEAQVMMGDTRGKGDGADREAHRAGQGRVNVTGAGETRPRECRYMGYMGW